MPAGNPYSLSLRCVIVVPPADDPGRLLQPRPGYAPPTMATYRPLGSAHQIAADPVDPSTVQWSLAVDVERAAALVLAWAGTYDIRGIEHAYARCCPDGTEKAIGLVIGRPPLYEAIRRAKYAEWLGYGVAAFLGQHGMVCQ